MRGFLPLRHLFLQVTQTFFVIFTLFNKRFYHFAVNIKKLMSKKDKKTKLHHPLPLVQSIKSLSFQAWGKPWTRTGGLVHDKFPLKVIKTPIRTKDLEKKCAISAINKVANLLRVPGC